MATERMRLNGKTEQARKKDIAGKMSLFTVQNFKEAISNSTCNFDMVMNSIFTISVNILV